MECYAIIGQSDNLIPKMLVYSDIERDYCLATFIDFPVIMEFRSGYINGTHLCKLSGKSINEFRQFVATETRLEGFRQFMREEARSDWSDSSESRSNVDFRITFEEKKSDNSDVCGTYYHPDVIHLLAAWISDEYAWKISRVVKQHAIHLSREKGGEEEDYSPSCDVDDAYTRS